MPKPMAVRRTMQQVKHCVEEAMAVIENDEHAQEAVDDLEQAQALLADVLPKLRSMAGGRVR